VLNDDEGAWLIGDAAVHQRFAARSESADWYTTPAYRRLMLANFAQLTTGTAVKVAVVTGLPVAHYQTGKAAVEALFTGVHRVEVEGRTPQRIEVTHCRVIPQPFGTVLALALTDNGKIADRTLAEGPVGVIDIGGKTTNLLSVRGFREVSDETASVNVGGWDAAREVRDWLNINCPGLDLRDHDLMGAIRARETWYRGERVDLAPVVDETLNTMAEAVIGSAGQLWNGGHGLKAILVSGGGAHLLGEHLRRRFPSARVVADPQFANATGYYRFAVTIGARG
jgi:plasmid segregation protein ParM